jgi:hypothetical protein
VAEPTYHYKTEGGRDAFTNVRSLVPPSVAAGRVDVLTLPELTHLDFEAAHAAELERINARLARAHAELKASAACQEAVREGELPWYRHLYAKHPHWVWLAVLFLAMAVMGKVCAGWLPQGMWARTMFFIAPLLLAVGMLASLAKNMHETLATVKREASLCSGELPDADPSDPASVQRRAGLVGQVQQVLRVREVRLEREMERIGRLSR